MPSRVTVSLDQNVIELREHTSINTGLIPIKGIVHPYEFIKGACKFLGKENPYPEGVYFFPFCYTDGSQGLVYYSEDAYSSDMVKETIPLPTAFVLLVDDSVPKEAIQQALSFGLTVSRLEVKLVTVS